MLSEEWLQLQIWPKTPKVKESMHYTGNMQTTQPFKDVFDNIHFLSDPVSGQDSHYKTFEELLGSITDKYHRPSLQKSKEI